MKALFSIHDVMPGTLEQVRRILELSQKTEAGPLTLLVVPGRDWTLRGLETLRQWADLGHELAAHGWIHHTRPRRLYHRLHSILISRDVAEHLEYRPEEVIQLMLQSSHWFSEHGLPSPRFYVPPAWALGPVQNRHIRELPYERIETTSGFLFPSSGKRVRLPLVGFEADTAFRAVFLKLWNRSQILSARRSGKPLRVSIHPQDLDLRLGDDLRDLLERRWIPLLPAAIADPALI